MVRDFHKRFLTESCFRRLSLQCQYILLSDVSIKNCQAGDVKLVKFGKAKDDNDKGLPVFNVSLIFDMPNRILEWLLSILEALEKN